MVHLGDITKLDGGKIPAVHVIVWLSLPEFVIHRPARWLVGCKNPACFIRQFTLLIEMRDASGGLYPAIVVWKTSLDYAIKSDKRDYLAQTLRRRGFNA